jgi:hypothetical protein
MRGRVVSDPAVLLAAVRASGGLDIEVADTEVLQAASKAAEASGRVLVTDCSIAAHGELGRGSGGRGRARGVTFRWMPQCTPSPEDSHAYQVRMLPPISRLTWACCLGLAWPRRSEDLYPGVRFMRAAVVDTAADLGAGGSWVKAALDHDLIPAGLIMADPSGDRGSLRLGPAAASLPEPFIEAMRRFHEQLPRPAPDADDARMEEC